MFSLDMALLKSATSSPIPWNDVQRPSFATNDYQPVMALAQNHIHFMDVPGLSPGNAQIFVIHCKCSTFLIGLINLFNLLQFPILNLNPNPTANLHSLHPTVRQLLSSWMKE